MLRGDPNLIINWKAKWRGDIAKDGLSETNSGCRSRAREVSMGSMPESKKDACRRKAGEITLEQGFEAFIETKKPLHPQASTELSRRAPT